MPVIFHVDMDAFFVSVEELLDPSLKGKPVVVGGRADQRGVVAAASYAARRLGVHSAMPLRTAARICPQAIFIEGHPRLYSEYSGRVCRIFRRFTPAVAIASIDEAFLDMTGTERLHGPPLEAAHKLHEAVKRETGLNCSIGIGSSFLVAKVASDLAKPNGILYVLPGCEARWLAPLEVGKIPGIGKVTQAHLAKLGIYKVGDLARLEEKLLEQHFGRWGRTMALKARGEDAGAWFDNPVFSMEPPKSVGHERTFERDIDGVEELDSTLAALCEMVGRRLREYGLYARTVQIKIRYKNFQTYTRAKTLDGATQLDTELHAAARALFRANWNGTPVRLLGVQASNLQTEPGQMSLLDQQRRDRMLKVFSTADRIRERFGDAAVALAAGLKGRFRQRVHENPATLRGTRSGPDQA